MKENNKKYNERRAQGVCVWCGNTIDYNFSSTKCPDCATKNKERNRIRKEELVKKGLCRMCSQPRGTTGTNRYCRLCANSAGANQYLRRKSKGNCGQCGKVRDTSHKSQCSSCWFKERTKSATGSTDLTEQLKQKLIDQKYKCYYTGVELIIGSNCSVEHLKSRKNHPELINDLNNLVWCTKRINSMKNDLNEEDFLELCSVILNQHNSRKSTG